MSGLVGKHFFFGFSISVGPRIFCSLCPERVVPYTQVPMASAAIAEGGAMSVDDVRTSLRKVGPVGSWLRMDRVESSLTLDRWSLLTFVEANKSTERGRTRHRTKLSPPLQRLSEDGIFFRHGHVAVCEAGSSSPEWSGPTYTVVEEPRLNATAEQPSHGRRAVC